MGRSKDAIDENLINDTEKPPEALERLVYPRTSGEIEQFTHIPGKILRALTLADHYAKSDIEAKEFQSLLAQLRVNLISWDRKSRGEAFTALEAKTARTLEKIHAERRIE